MLQFKQCYETLNMFPTEYMSAELNGTLNFVQEYTVRKLDRHTLVWEYDEKQRYEYLCDFLLWVCMYAHLKLNKKCLGGTKAA